MQIPLCFAVIAHACALSFRPQMVKAVIKSFADRSAFCEACDLSIPCRLLLDNEPLISGNCGRKTTQVGG